jgi:hypothetical protein
MYGRVGISSDLGLAIMPIFFIWSLHWPAMERIFVTILMALGTIAALAGVMKSFIQRLGTLAKELSMIICRYFGGIEPRR